MRPVDADAFMAQYLAMVQTLPRAGGAIAHAFRARVSASQPSTEAWLRPTRIKRSRLGTAPQLASTLTDLTLRDMGSNAWALEMAHRGRQQSVTRQPALPLVWHCRFWESTHHPWRL